MKIPRQRTPWMFSTVDDRKERNKFQCFRQAKATTRFTEQENRTGRFRVNNHECNHYIVMFLLNAFSSNMWMRNFCPRIGENLLCYLIGKSNNDNTSFKKIARPQSFPHEFSSNFFSSVRHCLSSKSSNFYVHFSIIEIKNFKFLN